MQTRGDLLLFALSARRETSWAEFKKLATAIAAEGEGEEGGEYMHWRAFRLLAALGHVDAREQRGKLSICAAPPVLARLPRMGLPVAVLCGSRSPRTSRDLVRVASGKAAVRIVTGTHGRALAPSRIEVEAPCEARLDDLARELGIHYSSTPPCWLIASVAGTIHEYVESLSWEAGGDLNWYCEDFEVDAARFSPVCTGPRNSPRLSRYRDPRGLRWRYRLYLDGRFADVDADWGRYAVLHMSRKVVLEHDPATCEVRVPLGVPLPVVHARALVLASGSPPVTREVPGKQGVRRVLAYHAVPYHLFQVVARKLGQLDKEGPP